MGEYMVSAVLAAVADPTRRAILDQLRITDARVTDLADKFPVSLNSVSKHVKVLERASLVSRDVRGREHVISLRAAPLGQVASWLSQYETFWEDALDGLESWAGSEADKDLNSTLESTDGQSQ